MGDLATDRLREIERLKGHVANLQDIAGKQNAEIERLKADRDWQDKCAELQARQIMEQTDEIERLKAERDAEPNLLRDRVIELTQRAEAAEKERDELLVKAKEALRAAKEFADDEYSMTGDLRHKATVSGLCDKIDAALQSLRIEHDR